VLSVSKSYSDSQGHRSVLRLVSPVATTTESSIASLGVLDCQPSVHLVRSHQSFSRVTQVSASASDLGLKCDEFEGTDTGAIFRLRVLVQIYYHTPWKKTTYLKRALHLNIQHFNYNYHACNDAWM